MVEAVGVVVAFDASLEGCGVAPNASLVEACTIIVDRQAVELKAIGAHWTTEGRRCVCIGAHVGTTVLV
jgi:hypothetical protein